MEWHVKNHPSSEPMMVMMRSTGMVMALLCAPAFQSLRSLVAVVNVLA